MSSPAGHDPTHDPTMTSRWRGRRVAVTGATGMTGRVLVERLVALGASVRVAVRPGIRRDVPPVFTGAELVACDLESAGDAAGFLQGADELLHLAACRHNVAINRQKAGEVARHNVTMTVALLDGLAARPVPVTFFSTAYIYAPLDPLRLQEQPGIDGYTVGKYACELLWLAAAREWGQPLLIVRPVGIYGPGDHFAPDSNFIPSLIVKAAQGPDQLPIWGTGDQQRSFLYVDDVVGALLRLLDHAVHGIQYLSPPEVTTVRDIATRIRDLVRPGLPLFFDTTREAGVGRLDCLPLHPCLADFPWTSLAEGLRRTARAGTAAPGN